MEKLEYPKWMYCKNQEAVIVMCEADKLALGKDWAETPAAFDDAKETEKKKSKKEK
jgi:hypothetical protein